MPYYHRLTELPKGVRNNLSPPAQKIYRAAFNNAWQEYGENEERAHRVAWAAVKQKYVKDEKTGRWKLRRASARSVTPRRAAERVART